MKLKILLLLFFLIIEICPLPRFALRKGGECIDCHVNPSGGILRNEGGWKFGKNMLPMISPHEYEMSSKLNENILFGFDFRGQYLTVFRENSNRSDFQRMTGSVYAGVGISDNIDIIARYDFIWGVWEAYGIARVLPNESYIKAGSFLPNYGIRLDDHTAYIRGGDMGLITTPSPKKRGLIYDPLYVESGGEVGINISDFGLFTASVGSSRQTQFFVTDPTYTASLQLRPYFDNFNLLFGGSAAFFRTTRFNSSFQTIYPQVKMFGGFAGIGLGKFTLMGEYDIADQYLAPDTASTAVMIEAAYQLFRGLDAVIRYDRFDPSNDLQKDDLQRLVLGFEFHPYSFIEIRPQYRMQIEDPKIKNDSFVVQFHLWY